MSARRIVSAMRGALTRAAITLVVVLISIVGGRIIPWFTRNWMAKQGFTHGLPGQATGSRPSCCANRRFNAIVNVVTNQKLLLVGL